MVPKEGPELELMPRAASESAQGSGKIESWSERVPQRQQQAVTHVDNAEHTQTGHLPLATPAAPQTFWEQPPGD